MMDELNPMRQYPSEGCELAPPSRVHSRRSSPGLRRVAWELFRLVGLVAVAGYIFEWSGMRNSGSAWEMILGGHAGPVRSIEFVRGTSNLVTLDITGESWLWDATTHRVLYAMGGPGSPVSSQALDPPGQGPGDRRPRWDDRALGPENRQTTGPLRPRPRPDPCPGLLQRWQDDRGERGGVGHPPGLINATGAVHAAEESEVSSPHCPSLPMEGDSHRSRGT